MDTVLLPVDDKHKRLDWVNISKGITIILMVMGHTSLPDALARWIWSFHMPFFFFISGLLTGFNKPIGDFITHKAKSLLLPFIWYGVIVWVLFALGRKENILVVGEKILCEGWGGIALWFVPVLFVSLIIVRVFENKRLPGLIIVSLIVGSILDAKAVTLPWTMTSVPFAIAILATGRYFKNPFLKQLGKCKEFRVSLLYLVGGLIISIVISHYWRLDMACNQINPVIFIYVGALAGIVFISVLSTIIARISYEPFNVIKVILNWCGKNTYEIMALSQVIIINMNAFFTKNFIVKYAAMALCIYLAVQFRDMVSRKPLPKDPI